MLQAEQDWTDGRRNAWTPPNATKSAPKIHTTFRKIMAKYDQSVKPFRIDIIGMQGNIRVRGTWQQRVVHGRSLMLKISPFPSLPR
jgi:hypothetical protein